MYGAFDAVLYIGLLYHLEFAECVPRAAEASPRRLVIVQTQYASDVAPEGCVLGDWATQEGQRVTGNG